MKDRISRTIGSGGVKYDCNVSFTGMEIEAIQEDAMSFYVWKVQRTLRDMSDAQREDALENGINIHANDVGKPVVSTEKLVNQMSDEQALKAIELLKAKLGK